MREGVLFEITREHLETGIKGWPIGYCVTSHVDPHTGLSYIGRPILSLGARDPIEVIYLLYYGEAGTLDQVGKFYQTLSSRAECKKETLCHIESLPRTGEPIDHLATALLIVGMCESTGQYREDALNLIAKIPHIAATVINSHAGWGETPVPRPELGYIENFVHMLRIPEAKSAHLVEMLRMFIVLSLDHGGGSLPAFVGKAVASSLEHLYGSLAAAMAVLGGERYRKGLEESFAFVQEVHRKMGENGSSAELERLIRQRLDRGEGVPGFGHKVLKIEDPRATFCYDYCQANFGSHPLVKVAGLIRVEGTRVLKKNPRFSDPFPNFDAIGGVLLTVGGFPYLDYAPVLLGMARSVGIAIQILYERLYAKEGNGTPMMRPSYLYKHGRS